jgi:hypothetical protein
MNRLRLFFVLLIIGSTGFSQDQPEAREIVVRSLRAAQDDALLATKYTFRQRDVIRLLDSSSHVKSVRTKLEELLYIGGKKYTRLLAKDDQPLPSAEEKKQSAHINEAVAEANRLSPSQRAKREEDLRRQAQQDEERRKYIPPAFNFKLLGSCVLNGREVYRIRGTPKPDYCGKYALLLCNLQGTLFIDKKDYHWVKLEAEALKDISLGLFLARISQGSIVTFEETRVNDEIWLPFHISAAAQARFLVKKVHQEEDVKFSNYRKFQTDSRILDTAAIRD